MPSVDVAKCLEAIADGDAARFHNLLCPEGEDRSREELQAAFTQELELEGLHGTLIFFAGHRQRFTCLRHMHEADPEAFEAAAAGPALRLVSMLRYRAVECLVRLARPTLAAATIDSNDGPTTLLHAACLRQRPDVGLLTTLLDNGAKATQVDGRGWSPLHVVAQRSSGVEGRVAARLLVSHGARRAAESDDGQTALQVCTNPQIREFLSVEQAPSHVRARELPEPDEDFKASVDRADGTNLPPLKPLSPVSPKRHHGSADDAATFDRGAAGRAPSRKGPKKLSSSAMEGMVQRLYADSNALKQRWMEQQNQKLKEQLTTHHHQAQPEEVQGTVERLYDAAGREERRAALLAKYVHEPTEEERQARQRSPDDINASVHRLSVEAAANQRAKREQLAEQAAVRASTPMLMRTRNLHSSSSATAATASSASPVPSTKPPRLSKHEQQAMAARLHDESVSKNAETTAKLHAKYVAVEKTRFSGGGKAFTREDWAAMGDRLTSAKK